MVFAAQKLRMHPKLGNPTVMNVVDRIDLDTQITATFNVSDVPNMVGVATRIAPSAATKGSWSRSNVCPTTKPATGSLRSIPPRVEYPLS
jgi:hypothetical protein